MARAVRTPAAEEDPREIVYYIAVEQQRPHVADQIVDGVIAKCEKYAHSPQIGEARPDLGRDLRCFPYKRWVVIYRPVEDGLEVLRIVDGARDYPQLFDR